MAFSAARPSARRRVRLAAVAGAAGAVLWIAGCSQVLPTQLPELVSVSRKVLSEEEQKKAIDELTAKKATHQGEAIKQIESRRGH
jgi:hypothetical protein